MQLNEISDKQGATKNHKRVGRGIGSGTGKTSGSGHKGQKSRSGVSLLGFEGGQMPLYRRLPKRGFNNPFSKDFSEINLSKLQTAIDAKRLDYKQPITDATLLASGLVSRSKDGVKLLAQGEIKVKLDISVSRASKAAISAVEKAGGSVTLLNLEEVIEGKGKSRDRISSERQARYAAIRAEK
jgi:large subunit ribosomal protein L15